MALVLAVLLATADLAPQGHQRRLYAERSFFGVVQVVLDREGRYTVLLHGTTFHGLQAIAPEDHDRPTLYYHPSGPVGKIMASLDATRPKGPPLEVGVVGLGVGAIAAYGKPGQRFTFFEIDPAVARIASNPQFFTHLSRSKAETRIVLGDGRLTLAEEDDGAFDLLVLDAFASDSIPVHLLTREALALYVRKLRGPQSLLAFHVSNRHVPLGGVLAAHAADLGLKAWAIEDVTTERQRAQGKEGSLWIVLSPSGSSENAQAGWIPLVANPESPRWTDDFSNVFELMKWF
jgi:hypothetical protein